MQIQVDRLTSRVVGLNGPATPLYLEIEVDDNFTLIKEIEEIVGENPKTNDDEMQLYRLPSSEELTTEETPFPVIEDIKELKTVTLETRPEAFTLEEVLVAKYENILNSSSCDHILADMFLDENDLDLADPNHKANTGMGILQLLPNGQAKTKTIDLEATAETFTLLEFDADPNVDIYLNDILFTNGKTTIAPSLNSVTIKFVNTTDKPKMARAYAIGY